MKKALKIILRVILILICIILLFMAGVFIFHRAMLVRERELASSPIGEMISVDGGEMCVYTEGTSDSGKPTIVFMSGYGTPSPILDFRPLYSRLSSDYRIAVVEKFGYGFSDETDAPRDIDTMLEQTRKALSGAEIEAPYILCPHSASGIEAIYWAQKYPEEISGIAAIDIAMPGYFDNQDMSLTADYLMQFITNSGLLRLIPDSSVPFAFNSPYLTEKEKAQYKAIMYSRRGSDTMIAEAEMAVENMEIISNGEVPSVPMLFFTSKQMFTQNSEWYLSLARNYTDNKAEYTDVDYGHYIHVEAPDFTADEIRRFAEESCLTVQ